jgi:hypothetical protein
MNRVFYFGLWCKSDRQFLTLFNSSFQGKVSFFFYTRILLLLKIITFFRAPLANILAASFKNLDSLRFGAMFGSFALLWKGVNNGMRLYRGKDDRLNGLVSGAVAGLSILFEKKERRVDIAQQLLVRYMEHHFSTFFLDLVKSCVTLKSIELYKQFIMQARPVISFTLKMVTPCCLLLLVDKCCMLIL